MQDEAAAMMIELAAQRAEGLALLGESLGCGDMGGHPIARLVADVMVAGQHVEGRFEVLENAFETPDHRVIADLRRHLMDHVTKVKDKFRCVRVQGRYSPSGAIIRPGVRRPR